MNKNICIYPKDPSTDFLVPLFDAICSSGFSGFHLDTNVVENKIMIFEILNNAQNIIFLGHGSSGKLYGTPYGNSLSDLITNNNIHLLKGKRLLLLSCNSDQFCEYYSLRPSISFGDMPTGKHDVDSQLENDPSFPRLEEDDINVYNSALVRTLTRAILSIEFNDLDRLYSKVLLYANVEISECLLKKRCTRFREVAGLLQMFKNECTLML